MNRALTWINLAGVLALSGLCIMQWRTNRRLNQDVIAIEKARLTQQEQLTELERKLSETEGDLERFRTQLSASGTVASEARLKLTALEAQVPQLTAERDQLQDRLKDWAEAVKVRDSRIEEAENQFAKLLEERNSVVERFNALAAKHDKLVAELNAERARASPQTSATENKP